MTKLPSLLDRQFFVGFDDLFDKLDTTLGKVDKFPPHDVIKTGDHTYEVVIAVAGFSKDDIKVDIENNTLVIRGFKPKESLNLAEKYPRFIYNGISNRSFTKNFTLQPQIIVKKAKVENGLLTIQLEEIIPDEQKSRNISID